MCPQYVNVSANGTLFFVACFYFITYFYLMNSNSIPYSLLFWFKYEIDSFKIYGIFTEKESSDAEITFLYPSLIPGSLSAEVCCDSGEIINLYASMSVPLQLLRRYRMHYLFSW